MPQDPFKNDIFYKWRKVISSILLCGISFLYIGAPIAQAVAMPVKITNWDESALNKRVEEGGSIGVSDAFSNLVTDPLKTLYSGLQTFDYKGVLDLVLRGALNKVIDNFYNNVVKTFEQEYRIKDWIVDSWSPAITEGFSKFHAWVAEQAGGKMQAPFLKVMVGLEQSYYNRALATGRALNRGILEDLENLIGASTNQATPKTVGNYVGTPAFFMEWAGSAGNSAFERMPHILGKMEEISSDAIQQANMEALTSDMYSKRQATNSTPSTAGTILNKTIKLGDKLDFELVTLNGHPHVNLSMEEDYLVKWGYVEIASTGINDTSGLVKGSYKVFFDALGGNLFVWSFYLDQPVKIALGSLNYSTDPPTYTVAEIEAMKFENNIWSGSGQGLSNFTFTSRVDDPGTSGWTGLIAHPGTTVKNMINGILDKRLGTAQEANNLTGVAKVISEVLNGFTSAISFKVTRATTGPMAGCPVGFESSVKDLTSEIGPFAGQTSDFGCIAKAWDAYGWSLLGKVLDYVSCLGKKLLCWIFQVDTSQPTAGDVTTYEMVSDTAAANYDPGAQKVKLDESSNPVQTGAPNKTESILQWTAQYFIYTQLIKPHLPDWQGASKEYIEKFFDAMIGTGENSWIDDVLGGLESIFGFVIDIGGDIVATWATKELVKIILGWFGWCKDCDASPDNWDPDVNPLGNRDFIEFPYEITSPGQITAEIFGINGTVVREFAQGEIGVKQPGVHILRWNLRNNAGEDVASGINQVIIYKDGQSVKNYAKSVPFGICNINPAQADPTTSPSGRDRLYMQNYMLEVPNDPVPAGQGVPVTLRWTNHGNADALHTNVRLFVLKGVSGDKENFYQGLSFYDTALLTKAQEINSASSTLDMVGKGSDIVKNVILPSNVFGPGANALIMTFEGASGNNCEGNDRIVQIVNIQSGTIELLDYKFSDDNADSTQDGDKSSGDGPGAINPEEKIEMTFSVNNFSGEALSGLRAKLMILPGDHDFETLSNQNEQWIDLPAIAPGATISPAQDFNFYVRAGTSNGWYNRAFRIYEGNTNNFIYEKTLLIEVKNKCYDGFDNDGDNRVDYPSDGGCVDRQDNDETGGAPPAADLPDLTDGVGSNTWYWLANDNDNNGKASVGDEIALRFRVKNIGEDMLQPAQDWKVEFYYKYGNDSLRNISSWNWSENNVLGHNASVIMDFNENNGKLWEITKAETVCFAFDIDADDDIEEEREDNNKPGFNANSYCIYIEPQATCQKEGWVCSKTSDCCTEDGLTCSNDVCISSEAPKDIDLEVTRVLANKISVSQSSVIVQYYYQNNGAAAILKNQLFHDWTIYEVPSDHGALDPETNCYNKLNPIYTKFDIPDTSDLSPGEQRSKLNSEQLSSSQILPGKQYQLKINFNDNSLITGPNRDSDPSNNARCSDPTASAFNPNYKQNIASARETVAPLTLGQRVGRVWGYLKNIFGR